MDSSILEKAFELCQEVASENGTDHLLSGMESLLKNSSKSISKEIVKIRSSKRKIFHKVEAKLLDYFMQMCKFNCTKENIRLVHNTMTLLGYDGYENKTRFRQRTENTLKKWKSQGRMSPIIGRKTGQSVKIPRCYSGCDICVKKPCLRTPYQQQKQIAAKQEVIKCDEPAETSLQEGCSNVSSQPISSEVFSMPPFQRLYDIQETCFQEGCSNVSSQPNSSEVFSMPPFQRLYDIQETCFQEGCSNVSSQPNSSEVFSMPPFQRLYDIQETSLDSLDQCESLILSDDSYAFPLDNQFGNKEECVFSNTEREWMACFSDSFCD